MGAMAARAGKEGEAARSVAMKPPLDHPSALTPAVFEEFWPREDLTDFTTSAMKPTSSKPLDNASPQQCLAFH
eukprot:CAMPEP_0196577226 /NCGR_PEP_ID=MMETSP1081-20130531/6333_1 /TAXON_ID=36882 /ORGANISM="Pyramimonas amylifera, Strain CCMP720" /LENGTH=72 /DNA_ID=CAMNT_0041896093 /DNA_START=534 /DNA_END=749 /DNA_ORIENTATION=-